MTKKNIRKINALFMAGILCSGILTAAPVQSSENAVLTASAAVYNAVPDGYTGIYSADDLNNIRNNLGGNYILMNDIDLSGVNWTPIGNADIPFMGNFDGNGYAIKNLNISGTLDANVNSVGLFGECTISVSITHLALVNCNIDVTIPESVANRNTYIYVGGISGYNGNISECYATGSVKADINCSSAVNTYCIGGLGGLSYVQNGFNNCNVTVNITNATNSRTSFDVGGVAGYSANMVSSYSTGTINVTQGGASRYYVGSVCGYSNNSTNLFNSDYYLNSASSLPASGNHADSYYSGFGVEGLSDSQMRSQSSFAFDFDTIWQINSGANYAYPTLKNVPYSENGSSPIIETQPTETTSTTTTTETTSTTTTTETTSTTTTTETTSTTTTTETTSTTPETTTTETTSTTPETTTTETTSTTTTTETTSTTTSTTTTTETTSTTPETTTTETTSTTPETTTTEATSTTPETTTTETTSTTPETTTTEATSTTPETTETTPTETTPDDFDRADINGDGVVNATDATLILRYATALNSGFHEEQMSEDIRQVGEKGDLNYDGNISATDASGLLRYITSFTVGLESRLEDFF